MKVLVVLVSVRGVRACLDAARVLAREIGADRVEALNVDVDPDRMIGAAAEVAFQRLREESEGTADARSDAVHAAFDEWVAASPDSPVAINWTERVGAEEATVIHEAAQADVLVMSLGHHGNLDGADAREAAIYKTGKPTLLVPAEWKPSSRDGFGHVVVALGETPGARRALEAAQPLLRAAHRVTALHIGSRDDPAMAMVDEIAQTGITPQVHVASRDGVDVGTRIAREAQSLDGDLIVAGAYRHSELIEWLTGGTTRNLIAAATMPLLLSH